MANYNNSYGAYKQKVHNKNMHCKNGNIDQTKKKVQKLKLLHVNKGLANFRKKVTEMRILTDKFSPDIFCIAEANVSRDYKDYMSEFSDYHLELSIMFNNIGISRNIILIRKGINYKRRLDLENENLCNIWIEISLGTSRSLLIMGGYRQWSLLKSLDVNNKKDKVTKQLIRYKLTLELWKKALSEKKDVVVLTDDNIDSAVNASHNKIYNIKNIEKIHNEHLEENNLVTHNNKFTWFQSHCKPSVIDHIYSNCPTKITPVETINNIYSDHSILLTRYLTKENIYVPKFINVRNFRLLTRNMILNYINNSEELENLFTLSDPNEIAASLQMELNSIIECIAPQKKVQFRKDYKPYLNSELLEKIKMSNDYLKEAIKSNDITDWRQFKHYRNDTMKSINMERKKLYFRKIQGYWRQMETN